MARDHYEVLGVPVDATPEEIRRSYRTLSLRCHPDKNPGLTTAEQAFQELSNAYRTLSNPTARKEYDRLRDYVPSSPNDPFADYQYRRLFADALAKTVQDAEGKHIDPDQLFESLFARARPAPPTSRNCTPTPSSSSSSFSSASTTTQCPNDTSHRTKHPNASAPDPTKSSRQNQASQPNAPSSSAAESHPTIHEDPAADASPCTKPQNEDTTSRTTAILEKPPDREIELLLSLEELYAGCVKKQNLRRLVRDRSHGNFVEQTDLLTVIIKPGYRPGDKIRFREASDEGVGIIPADVVYVIKIIPHPRFTAVGSDVRLFAHIALVDALAGAVLQIETLSGEVVQVRTTDVVTPGSSLRVQGKGLPRPAATPGKPITYGDLVVVFTVEFPQKLSADDKVKLRDLFRTIDTRADGNNDLLSMRRTSSMFACAGPTKRSRSVHTASNSQSLATTIGSIPGQSSLELRSGDAHSPRGSAEAENINPREGNRSNTDSINVPKSKSKKKIGFLFF